MTVVITGASRGIGAGLASHYRAQGLEVMGTSRSLAADFTLDVTHPSHHSEMARALGEKPVELLVCNAGVYLDKGDNLETGYGADLWAQSFATNGTGVFLAIQALLPHLRRASSPRIAIISSQMASSELAPGGSYIYRASKAAVLNLGRNLATDLKPEGIAVGIYHPGWVQTDMGGDAAAITVEESVAGLVERFASLNVETTGSFETWDGRAHPY
ncbi:SDR family NAD(P)-dependent oxidoreductase [Sulfitobacter sp. F26169L]|uniref:SDR family NAD(P)-dependent oxidoreductase n=1 Tax=Sulfitobacter sp. F26169L TaxID=2996015 RepID=UPI002260EC86|nr:SDR family NAD(P)-dependent oxidoreductase [Sulfitobacter sp. F26169L]MCX7567636.1 SDR family NAD(P)-dependent oxidoreductase [Sulfitobacter sp. F26169L]